MCLMLTHPALICIDLCRDSTTLKQALHCARYSIGYSRPFTGGTLKVSRDVAMSFSKPGRRDDLLFAFALRVNLGCFICLRLIVRQPRNNISRRSAIPKHCEGLAASADPSFAPSLRGGAIGRGGAPLGKGDGGFRKKLLILF